VNWRGEPWATLGIAPERIEHGSRDGIDLAAIDGGAADRAPCSIPYFAEDDHPLSSASVVSVAAGRNFEGLMRAFAVAPRTNVHSGLLILGSG
jgi:hypothetical protein